MKKTVEIARYPDHDMAYILVDGENVYSGNYWDFHSGCYGSKVAGYELSGIWDEGIDSLGGVLKLLMEKEGHEVTLTKKTLTDEEYETLGGYV